MSYKFSTGSLRQGDIYYEDDREGDPTYIDFGMDSITLRPSGSQILYTQHNMVGIGTTEPESELHVNGTTLFSSSANQELIRVAKADGDTREIAFENEGVDIGSIYFNSAEHMFIRQENGAKDLALRIASTNAIRIDGSTSRVGIFEDSPVTTLDVNGSFRVQSDSIAIQNSKTPANATDTGQAGQICWDTNYLYVCVALNTWKRIALSSW